jgi:Ser/Thr protein kinase RdoA (MazF antagonist)
MRADSEPTGRIRGETAISACQSAPEEPLAGMVDGQPVHAPSARQDSTTVRSDPQSPAFSASAAERALALACEQVGLDASGASLIRMGENAIYRLASAPVVVRVARTTELLSDVRKEVAVARWLDSAGLPAILLHGAAEQPLVADGRPVTFWELVDAVSPEPTFGELGEMLRRLHELAEPESLGLPPLDPFGRVPERLAVAEIPDGDREFLYRRLDTLRTAYDRLSFELPPGPVHGDAHTGNLLRERTGVVLMLDFERFASGPREWDLVEPALEHFRLGWESNDSYREFAATYGFDVAKWEGFDVLCSIRELTMTTWLMQNVGHSPEIATEFRNRVESLRDGTPRRWIPY